MHARLLVALAPCLGLALLIGAASAAENPVAPPGAAGGAAWQLHYSGQFFGTALGPLYEVLVDAGGAMTVREAGQTLATTTLPATELAALERLLTPARLQALASTGNAVGIGQVTRLRVAGARGTLDLEWSTPPPDAQLIVAEVLRLGVLVGPPRNFQIEVSERKPDSLDTIRVSANGFVELSRDGTRTASAFLPSTLLDPLRAALSDRTLRGLTLPGSPAPRFLVTVRGDLKADGAFDAEVAAPPFRAVFDEVRRLGAAVAASATPPASYTLVYTREPPGKGPKRTVKLATADRKAWVSEDGQPPREVELVDAQLAHLAKLLSAPAFALLAPPPAGAQGTVYRLAISGGHTRDLTFRGDVPPAATDVINYVDYLVH